MSPEILTDRAVLEIRGDEARNFLQGLITNDIRGLSGEAALYACLLTPQGKIVCDFLLYERAASILLDCARDSAAELHKRLLRYRLRARIDIVLREEWNMIAFLDSAPVSTLAWRDPRHPSLGWRTIQDSAGGDRIAPPAGAFLNRRLDVGIPEGGDFGSDRMFALDADLDELHGVSFAKGCYVGQELTSRMKHRGTARKRLLPIRASVSCLPKPETPVMAAEREIGALTSRYGDRGFALIRTDRLAEAEGVPLNAGGAPVSVLRPDWLFS